MPTRITIMDFTKFICFIGEPDEEREPDSEIWAMNDKDARLAFAKSRQTDIDRVSVVSSHGR